ncbi:MAG: hypothetical protein ATN36_04180 [Epulopiscium sp. Nele67-Bin005]|nr:MAG: hypothetical protein ATN36_04180 [Epulopiscium sp. Nele67-Bin005]
MAKNRRDKSNGNPSPRRVRSRTHSLDDYRQKRMSEAHTSTRRKIDLNENRNLLKPQRNTLKTTSKYEARTKQIRQEANKQTKRDSKAHEQRLRKRRNNYLILITCVVSMVVYIAVSGMQTLVRPTISYQTVQKGTIDNGKSYEAIIVREEQTYVTDLTGNIHYIIGEGQKVKNGGQVAVIADDASVQSVSQSLMQVDSAIQQVQDKRLGVSDYQQAIYNVQDEINVQMNNYFATLNNTSRVQVYDLRKNIDISLNSRAQIYAQDEFTDNWSLQEDRSNLAYELSTYQNTMVAAQSGVVSYKIDGYEWLNIDMDYYTFSDLIKDRTLMTPQQSNTQALVDEPTFKIVSNDNWQIVTYIPLQDTNNYNIGSRYNITIIDDTNISVSSTLKNIEPYIEENVAKLVFEMSEMLNRTLSQRVIQVIIGDASAQGLKIPLQAIVEKNILIIPSSFIFHDNTVEKVYRQSGNSYVDIPINVQKRDTEEGVVWLLQNVEDSQSIQLNDVLYLPDTGETYVVNEVDTLQGVYKINERFANFMKIKVILSNDEYAVLSNDSDTVVREYDQIISNPKGVEENQLLKNMIIQNE